MPTLALSDDTVIGDMRRIITTNGSMIWHVLVGPDGAVQFAVIQMPDIPGLGNGPGTVEVDGLLFMGADLGYHAYEPHYDGHGPMECEWLIGGRCFYDGSGLAGCDTMEEWSKAGFSYDWLWPRLYAYYGHMFNNKELSDGMGNS